MQKLMGILIVWAALGCKPLHGTSIVLIRTPQHIVVAADSRITLDNNKLPPGKGCKIFRVIASERLVKGAADISRE
jgi:hypothetical protein